MKALVRYGTRVIREILYILHLWKPATEPLLDNAVSSFVNVNREFWPDLPATRPRILVEGHLAEYGPNYLFRTALAAKAIEETHHGATIDIIVNGFSHQWVTARKAYKSFGIERWIFLGRKFLFIDPFIISAAFFISCFKYSILKKPNDIIELKLCGIKIGDLIYDQVMRSTKKPTITSLNFSVYKTIVLSIYYYVQYWILFRFNRYDYYIATHTAYPEYGILCRIALRMKVIVIETSDIQMSVYKDDPRFTLPTYHQGINAAIRNELEAASGVMEAGMQRLKKRFESELDQIDTLKAYSGKVYTREDLVKTLKISPDVKIGFILAHIFVDSPHLSSSMLFSDYYTWLSSTIEYCGRSSNMVWVVKPHPSYALYGEVGLVEEMIDNEGGGNIRLCPADLNTKSLLECADVITTVHGTAGLEFSCVGIPAILAGTPFYAGFGFTHEPKNINEYEVMISNAYKIDKLNLEMQAAALKVFSIWEDQFDWNNTIISSHVLARVWGNGVERNIVEAYKLITENLKINNPRKLKLWEFTSSICKA